MNEKSKVLFIHSGAELYGSDKILLEVLRCLDKSLYEPIVLIPNSGPLEIELENLNIKYIKKEFPILRRKYFNIIGIIKYFYEFIKSLNMIREIIIKNDIRVVTSNTLAVLEGAVICKILRVKHIWHIHEIIKEPKFMNKFYKLIVPSLTDNAICVSNAVKLNLFDENISKNIKVIHNGIEVKPDKLSICSDVKKNENLVIGMVGRVNKIKGQMFLLEVAKKLITNYPKLEFIMVGGVFEGQEYLMDELKNKVNELNLTNNIKIIDFDKEVDKYYEMFDIFVLPSIKPDSFPTVVLEAMNHSLPIVANVTGGVCEMIENDKNGYLIYEINPENMARCIELLIKNHNKRKNFGIESKKIMNEKFSTEIFSKNINQYYNDLI
ncbi:Spore coat protein SA [uncultured Clostridium sp.]|nr:Spore coat protein SA [uncultured Clostridium sp.]SCJ15419.1 Spore coat protein SA [uncultured Clostridium sp.]